MTYSSSEENRPKRKRNYESICSLYAVTHLIISFFAIYLSWKCNNNSFNLVGFIAAFFCPYLYIIWALATKGGCGAFEDSIKPMSMGPAPMAMGPAPM